MAAVQCRNASRFNNMGSRWVLVMFFRWTALLLLFWRSGCTINELHDQSLDAQRGVQWFLGRSFTARDWNHLKSVVRCWGRKGFWQLNSSIYKIPGNVNHDQYAEHVRKVSPCFNPSLPTFYSQKSLCYWILDTDTLRYEWRLHTGACHGFDSFAAFSTDRLCQVLRMPATHMSAQHIVATTTQQEAWRSASSTTQNIMIVGDSMNEQLSLAFRSISYRGDDMPKPTTSLCNTYKAHRAFRLPCSSETDSHPVRLYTRRNDRLSFANHSFYDKEANVHESDWLSQLKELNISLLVLNRGAHYEPDEILISHLNTTLLHLQTEHPNISIIWRNTPHGHLNHRDFTTLPPLHQPPPSSQLMKFNYNSFARQNALVERMLQEHFPHVIYMDVFTSTVLRADSHHDPLHYCQPGPVYNWVYYLYNIIVLVDEFHQKVLELKTSVP